MLITYFEILFIIFGIMGMTIGFLHRRQVPHWVGSTFGLTYTLR